MCFVYFSFLQLSLHSPWTGFKPVLFWFNTTSDPEHRWQTENVIHIVNSSKTSGIFFISKSPFFLHSPHPIFNKINGFWKLNFGFNKKMKIVKSNHFKYLHQGTLIIKILSLVSVEETMKNLEEDANLLLRYMASNGKMPFF